MRLAAALTTEWYLRLAQPGVNMAIISQMADL